MMKHFGTNIQKINPKLEDNSGKDLNSFPQELIETGIKVIQTAQNTSILHVISFASLKLSGCFRAKTANTKQKTAMSLMYPSTAQKPIADPNYSMIFSFSFLKERNSTSLGRHKVFYALGQNSLWQDEQSDESKKEKYIIREGFAVCL